VTGVTTLPHGRIAPQRFLAQAARRSNAAVPRTAMLQINGTGIQIRVHSVVKDAQFLATKTIQISTNYTDIGWAQNAGDYRLNTLSFLS